MAAKVSPRHGGPPPGHLPPLQLPPLPVGVQRHPPDASLSDTATSALTTTVGDMSALSPSVDAFTAGESRLSLVSESKQPDATSVERPPGGFMLAPELSLANLLPSHVLASLHMKLTTDSLGQPKLAGDLASLSRPSGWVSNTGFPHIQLKGAAARMSWRPYEADRREGNAEHAERVYEQEALDDGFDEGSWITGVCENQECFDPRQLATKAWWVYMWDRLAPLRVKAAVVVFVLVLYLDVLLDVGSLLAMMNSVSFGWAVPMLFVLAASPLTCAAYYFLLFRDTEARGDRRRAVICLFGAEPLLSVVSWWRRRDWRWQALTRQEVFPGEFAHFKSLPVHHVAIVHGLLHAVPMLIIQTSALMFRQEWDRGRLPDGDATWDLSPTTQRASVATSAFVAGVGVVAARVGPLGRWHSFLLHRWFLGGQVALGLAAVAELMLRVMSIAIVAIVAKGWVAPLLVVEAVVKGVVLRKFSGIKLPTRAAVTQFQAPPWWRLPLTAVVCTFGLVVNRATACTVLPGVEVGAVPGNRWAVRRHLQLPALAAVTAAFQAAPLVLSLWTSGFSTSTQALGVVSVAVVVGLGGALVLLSTQRHQRTIDSLRWQAGNRPQSAWSRRRAADAGLLPPTTPPPQLAHSVQMDALGAYDMDAFGNTALHLAACGGDTTPHQTLVRQLARLNPGACTARNAAGDTPLMLVVKHHLRQAQQAQDWIDAHNLDALEDGDDLEVWEGLRLGSRTRLYSSVRWLMQADQRAALLANTAGYLPVHYLVCNPWTPHAVFRAVLAVMPEVGAVSFAARRLWTAEKASCKEPAYLCHSRHQASGKYTVLRNFVLQTQTSPTASGSGLEAEVIREAVDAHNEQLVFELPLTYLAAKQLYEGMTAFLQAGADPHQELEAGDRDVAYVTPFSVACSHGFVAAAKLMCRMEPFPLYYFAPNRFVKEFEQGCEEGCFHKPVSMVFDRRYGVEPNGSRSQKHAPMFTAALYGRHDILAALACHPQTDPNHREKDGSTPLMAACCSGNIEAVKVLLGDLRVVVDLPDRLGRTPLWHAAANNHPEAVETLLNGSRPIRANYRAKDDLGTPFGGACDNGCTEALVVLLKHHPVVDVYNTGTSRTPLYAAALGGHAATIDLLLQCGHVDINDRAPGTGDTALHCAARENQHDVIRMLARHGDLECNTVDARFKQTALYRACAFGNAGTVSLMLEELPDLDVNKADNGRSPLYEAARRGFLEVVQALLAHPQIDVNCGEKDSRTTPFAVACRESHFSVVEALLKAPGVDTVQRDSAGESALYAACASGNADVVDLLLTYGGAQLNTPSRLHMTPVHAAVVHGHAGIVDLLAHTEGVDMNIPNMRGLTPLHSAVARNVGPTVAALLCSSTILPNARDAQGRTPLFAGVYRNNLDAVKELLKDRRVEVNKTFRIDKHRTVFHVACVTDKFMARALADVVRLKIHAEDDDGLTGMQLARLEAERGHTVGFEVVAALMAHPRYMGKAWEAAAAKSTLTPAVLRAHGLWKDSDE